MTDPGTGRTGAAAECLVGALDALAAGRPPVEVVPTGSSTLDRLLEGGLRCGHLTFLHGDRGVGTSMLGLQLVRHSAFHADVPSTVVAPDHSPTELHRRVIAAEARVPLHVLRSPDAVAAAWNERLTAAREGLATAPFDLTAGWPAVDAARVLSVAQDLARRGGVLLVDFWGVDEATALELARLARTQSCAVVLTGPEVPPRAADVVLHLDRDVRQEPSSLDTTVTVTHNRYGGIPEPGTLHFQGHHARFMDETGVRLD